MKILVCIKQVPGTSNVAVDPVTGTMKRDGVAGKLNPYDLYALETAFTLAETYGGSVRVVTMGPPQAKAVILEAASMGAENGTVLSDRKFAGADVLATAYTLSQGIKKMGDFDLILCGKQTTDGDTAQVGAEIAEFLGLPNVSCVRSVDEVKDGKVFVTAALDDRVIKESIVLPCLLSTDGDINTPRLPSYKVRKALTDDIVSIITFADFDDHDENHYGQNGSATQVERIFPPEKNADKHTITGSADETADGIFGVLRERKII